jgi:hypothetical protein
MHARLKEIVEYVDAQRAAILAAAATLPGERWTTPPAPGRWSMSDLCEHLHRVERGSARLIALKATEARDAGHPRETDDASLMGCLDFAGLTSRERPVAAPERVAPEGGWPRERVLEALAASRADLHVAIAAADGLALQSVRHAHPRLGEIDLYQWLLFIGQHEARHLPQVAEIAAAVGPAPADAPAAAH